MGRRLAGIGVAAAVACAACAHPAAPSRVAPRSPAAVAGRRGPPVVERHSAVGTTARWVDDDHLVVGAGPAARVMDLRTHRAEWLPPATRVLDASPRGTLLVDGEGGVALWRSAPLAPLRAFPRARDGGFAPDGVTLVLVDASDAFFRVDPSTLQSEPIPPIGDPADPRIDALADAVAPARRVAVTEVALHPVLWDADTGRPLAALRAWATAATGDGGRWLVVGQRPTMIGDAFAIRVGQRPRPLASIACGDSYGWSVAPDRPALYAAREEGDVCAIDLSAWTARAIGPVWPAPPPDAPRAPPDDDVLSPMPDLLALPGGLLLRNITMFDADLRDAEGGAPLLRDPSRRIHFGFAASGDGASLALGFASDPAGWEVGVLDARTRALRWRRRLQGDALFGAAAMDFAPGGQRVFVTQQGTTVLAADDGRQLYGSGGAAITGAAMSDAGVLSLRTEEGVGLRVDFAAGTVAREEGGLATSAGDFAAEAGWDAVTVHRRSGGPTAFVTPLPEIDAVLVRVGARFELLGAGVDAAAPLLECLESEQGGTIDALPTCAPVLQPGLAAAALGLAPRR